MHTKNEDGTDKDDKERLCFKTLKFVVGLFAQNNPCKKYFHGNWQHRQK